MIKNIKICLLLFTLSFGIAHADSGALESGVAVSWCADQLGLTGIQPVGQAFLPALGRQECLPHLSTEVGQFPSSPIL